MKLVFLFGDGAVGKMTVGQALAERTGLRLFHNHVMIEPVIEVFGHYDGETVDRLREVMFRRFAASGQYGMIFTFMWAFDAQEDWDYVERVKAIFAPYGTEFYYVELVAPLEVRLARNVTEDRLRRKASKRDIDFSNALILQMDAEHRFESREGEIPFANYLRIDNTDVGPDEAAERIRAAFSL